METENNVRPAVLSFGFVQIGHAAVSVAWSLDVRILVREELQNRPDGYCAQNWLFPPGAWNRTPASIMPLRFTEDKLLQNTQE